MPRKSVKPSTSKPIGAVKTDELDTSNEKTNAQGGGKVPKRTARLWFTLLVVILNLAWGVYYYQYEQLPMPLSVENAGKRGFSEYAAIEHVKALTDLGPHPVGSDALGRAVETVWIVIQRTAEWKPLQFLAFIFVYRIFEKLKASEPMVSPTFTEEGEDDGQAMRMGKRLLRSLSLVFGCIAAASMGFTVLLNLIEFFGFLIPSVLFNNQEMIVTVSTAVMLYIMASFYR